MASVLELKSPNGVDKLLIQHSTNESVTLNGNKIPQTDIFNVFTKEQIFQGIGTYVDPDYGSPRCIKVGDLGIASGGDIKATSFTSMNPNGASGLSLGKLATAETPYIDFNSSGYANDFDVRMMVSGGDATTGHGNLDLYLSAFRVNGNFVVDHGSNANGYYIRFMNGTQICTRQIPASAKSPIAHAWAANFYSYTPQVCISNDSSAAQYSSTVNVTTASFQFFSSTTNNTISVIGIGRWF